MADAPSCRAVFLDAGSVDGGDLDLDPLRDGVDELTLWSHSSPAEIPQRVAGHEVILTNKCVIDATVFEAADCARLLALAATGVNNIDLQAARRHEILVCNVRDYATRSVAQHCLMLMLNLATRFPWYRQRILRGEWSASDHFALIDPPISELAERRLGIIGYGVLGQAVAELARGFGMQVMVAERQGREPRPGRTSYDQVLAQADIISLHCPLTRETRGMINADSLARMRRGAWLVNTARGDLVDEAALAEALRCGHLGGAALDVLSAEPPPPDHPLMDPSIPNLLISPHSAWASRTARQACIEQLAAIVERFRQGRPIQRVI